MHDQAWQAIAEQVGAMAPSQVAQLQCAGQTLLVERRDEGYLALRELSTDYPRAALLQLSARAKPWQLIAIRGKCYLCAALPVFDPDTLERLGSFVLDSH